MFVICCGLHHCNPPIPSCCSLVNSCAQGPVHVRGCLKNHLGFWQRIKANWWVISADGYALSIIELPPRHEMTNRKSAFKEGAFVLEQIMELLSVGCVTDKAVGCSCYQSPGGT